MSVSIEKGHVLVYRVFDVAEEIDLGLVEKIAVAFESTGKKERLRFVRQSRHAMVMRNAPVVVNIGDTDFTLGNTTIRAETIAKIWDYGVISVILQIPIAPGTRWNDLLLLSALIENSSLVDDLCRQKAQMISSTLSLALKQPHEWEVFEDYVIFFFEKIEGISKAQDLLTIADVPALILGESTEKLSKPSREAILEQTFQYTENDLTVIDWNSAIVLEPSGQRDVPDVLEFALTHLMEVRYYDDLLDRKLTELYDAVEEGRGHKRYGKKVAHLSQEASTRFIEFSEFIERVENSLKVVGDFYLATIFRAATRRYRLPDWQQSITRKMNILARVSELLQGQVNVHRSFWLELIIIFLISFEVFWTVIRVSNH
jgi:hypothetical protein